MNRIILSAVGVVALAGLLAVGCSSSHESGVKSNYMTQWATVAADTKTTTDAAKSVLDGEGLKEVEASSTAMDGTAKAKMADGTKISVNVTKESDKISKLSVSVGTMGDPKMGAELAKKIKDKAEAK